jgi:hypothetical protein
MSVNKTEQNGNDPYWAAFRYAADEMTAAEAAEFETRLDADQTAREAVASVVGLSQAVRALPNEVFALKSQPAIVPLSRSPWSQPIGWMAVGIAACLAVMMTIQTVRPFLAPSNDVMIASASRTNDSLAMAWNRTRDAMNASDSAAAVGMIEVEDADASLDEQESFVAGESLPEGPSPTWLLAAVSANREPSARPEN